MTHRFCPILLFSVLLLCGCVQKVTRVLVEPEKIATLDRSSTYLKAHLRNGNLCILSAWSISQDQKTVTGEGELLNPSRITINKGSFQIQVDSIAIFESNVVETSPSLIALGVFTGITVAVAIYCQTNPKACFGSCPTFYDSDTSSAPIAEGFSASVVPSLEAADIDAIVQRNSKSRELDIVMKNEALETHVIRYVNILAVPHRTNERIFETANGDFLRASELIGPDCVTGIEGDCTREVSALDHVERFSTCDSTDLAKREEIDIHFSNPPSGEVGLVIASRQSLMSTYIFYQTLAYLGTNVGNWIAELERGDTSARKSFRNIYNALGNIEVFIGNESDGWTKAGEAGEQGPLASDLTVVPLPRSTHSPEVIKLRLARGLWRIDCVALVRLGNKVPIMRIHPSTVSRRNVVDDRSLGLLLDSTKVLVTLPGDTYTLRFILPEHPEAYDVFLESRGYYLEWIRKEWVAEQDDARALEIVSEPTKALQRMGPEFKRVEASMESSFWRSRYARP